jgi:hypothetical protein
MRAAERGANLGAITAALARLLERYGAAALQDAILEALLRDVPHPNAVCLALERQREQQGGEPPVAIVMPAHVRDRDAPVHPHALETYDQLKDQRARKIPTKSHPVVRSRRPSRRPDLHTARRRAQRQSRMAEGHREAAPRVLDGREHGGSLRPQKDDGP